MAEKSLFFNAFKDETFPTGYDKNYNADDISDWLSVVFETGVIKTDVEATIPQGLKVVNISGMVIGVKAGKGVIKGKGYVNDALKTFTITPPANGTRYDLVVLQYDNTQSKSKRFIKAIHRQGTTSIPTIANLTRNDTIYELLLAYIKVGTTSISEVVDTRGDKDLCPFSTAVKGYEDYYDAIISPHVSDMLLASSMSLISTKLASSIYNNRYSVVSVYTNGILEKEDDYSLITSGAFIQIQFTSPKASGSVVSLHVDNFINGEDLPSPTQLATLNNAVETLKNQNEFNYLCNGKTDNVEISNIVKAFLNVNTDKNSKKINIIGTFGYTAMAGGNGTTENPYKLFDLVATTTERVLTLDFTNCSQISVNLISGTSNVIFNAKEITIIGVNVVATNIANGTNVKIFNSTNGRLIVENSRFWINAYQDSLIAVNGTFANCRGSVSNMINNSYCFKTESSGILRLNGGEYYAYTGDNTKSSAILGQSGANAVSILYGVSAPTLARGSFYQTHSLFQVVGGGYINCTDLISQLEVKVIAGISNVRGTIPFSKQ